MDSYLLHSVEAENVRDSYSAFDTVDFHLDFDGRALICGSVRLEAEYQILDSNSAPLTGNVVADRVSNDPIIGGHSFCQSWITSFQKTGLVENLVEYPRYAAMVASGSMTQNDLMSAEMVAEGRSPDWRIQQKVVLPRVPADVGGGAAGTPHNGSGQAPNADANDASRFAPVNPDFSIRPLIAINNVASPNALLNYSTTGQVKLSVNLERDNVALYGMSYSNHQFRLLNMRLTFASVPAVPKQLPIAMKSHLCLKSTINSALSNVSSKVPAVCDSVAISFLTQTREVDGLFKNTELEKLPSLDKVRFMFNDSTNKYISYEIETIPEAIGEGIKAMNRNGASKTMARDDLLSANKGFMLGLDFNQAIDLSKQKFNVQLESATAIDPMNMYSYYSSLITL